MGQFKSIGAKLWKVLKQRVLNNSILWGLETWVRYGTAFSTVFADLELICQNCAYRVWGSWGRIQHWKKLVKPRCDKLFGLIKVEFDTVRA